ELAPRDELYDDPKHPYTQALLSAVPTVEPGQKERVILQGDVPSPANPPKGCNFCTRCPAAQTRCHETEPEWREVAPGRFAACHLLN
ncbi:MAG: ABC transporter ATP-binding protein, partial [Pseudomonadota bacterium]